MAYSPVTGTVPQYQKSDGTLASDYYIKFYESGTTTAFSMATDSTGGSTLDKAKINSSGYPVNGSDDVFIPHVDQNYKIVLYKNSTDADNDTTANADWVVDNVPQYSTGIDDAYNSFTGTPTQTSAITFTLTGDQRSTFSVGTKLKLTDSSTIYGIVTAVAYTTLTTVTVLATADLTGSLSAVSYAITTDDGQTKGLVLDARTYVVTASRTITNDFYIPKGGLINISSSQTLTISGSVDAGIYQIFSGGGVVQGFDAMEVYPEWWGAVADGTTNDRASIMAMFAYGENKTSGDDGLVMKFQPKKYAIAPNITYKGNNTRISGYGTTLYNSGAVLGGTAGYLADGLVIGNKQSADGEDGTNTSPFTYVRNVHVEGFYFELCRIGVYYVFCESCTGTDLVGDGASTVGFGNDANGGSPTYDCHFKNIRQKDFRISEMQEGANFYIIGGFYSEDFTIDGVYSEDASMAGTPANGKQITLNNCKRGIVENFHLDGVDKTSAAFEVISGDPASPSVDVIFRNGIVRRFLTGGVLFDTGRTEYCTIENTKFIDNVIAISVSVSKCTIQGNEFRDSDTYDLDVTTDASRNVFRNNIFEGTVNEGTAGGFALQAWYNNIGSPMDNVRALKGIDGTFPYTPRNAYSYYLGPETNITGNGTYATLASFTSTGELDEAGYFDRTTGVYTLPSVGVGGIFECKAAILLTGLTASATVVELYINVAGTRRLLDYHLNYGSSHAVSQVWLKGGLTTILGAGGTFKFEVRVQGEASDVVDTAASFGYVSITEQMGY